MSNNQKINRCVPKDKHDRAAIERAKLVGFPALNPILPELLTWLQDINWPVAPMVAELLSSADSEIIPHIQAIFSSNDSMWKHWILISLCPHLSHDNLSALRTSFEELATHPTPIDISDEVDQAAKSLINALINPSF